MIGLALTLAASSMGTFYTGNKLYKLCTAPPGDSDVGLCLGLVGGASDMLAAIQGIAGGSSVCTSSNVTLGQEKDVVVKYLSDHPEVRDRSAASIVLVALSQAFPCPKA
ncbi:hypothetical protein FPZ24_02020 [Sphingomonas panacisoli]|uniref:Rap1a immunity protein domain-containing protein n=1 Tax=Sphingomonas panacisoli TaxID=1813879 RepID=A0A5B8LGX1_9SPHN|nr:Rap1a/Tai family immunity protein [Sphingomonas panacisoli]QDZ06400.1 hypothetical protein FPZ24_02020 [Sphingomonas panacisoli]